MLPIPKEPAFRRAWLVYQLRLRGLTLAQLAAKEGVNYTALSRTMLEPNSHLEPIIARALGTTVRELFPERFDETGRRLHRVREPSREHGRGNIKAGGAA